MMSPHKLDSNCQEFYITATAQTPNKEANKIHCRRLHTTSLRGGCQATNLFKLVRHKPCFGNLIWNTQSQLVQQVERNYKYGTDTHTPSHNIYTKMFISIDLTRRKRFEGCSLILCGRVQGITYSCLYMKFVFQKVAKSEKV